MSGNAPKNPWGDPDPDARPRPDPDRAPPPRDAADPPPQGPMGAPPTPHATQSARARTAPPATAPVPDSTSPDPSTAQAPGPWARSPAGVAGEAAAAIAVGGMVLGQMGKRGPATPTPPPEPPRRNPVDPGQPLGLARTDFFAAIKANRRRTFVLCALLIVIGVALGGTVGWAFGTLAEDARGPRFAGTWAIWGGIFMLVFSAIWTAIALSVGDKIMLSMTGAREVGPNEEQMLHNVVEEMALAAGLPKPRIYMIETDALNAFATGLKPEKAVIGVTRGLVRTMNRDELQGVIGHEMSHIANNDILYMAAVGVLVGLIALVAELSLRSIRFMPSGRGNKSGGVVIVAIVVLLLVGLLAPIAAKLVQMAVSRQREYLADASSVKLTRNPLGLIGALRKLDAGNNKWDGASKATQHMFISNPFKNFSEKSSALMSTHPAVELRIERLTNLG